METGNSSASAAAVLAFPSCFLYKGGGDTHVDGALLRVSECNSGHPNQVEEQRRRLGRSY